MSITDSTLEQLKNTIEAFSKVEQIQILKILKENPTVKLNENKSGVYVNLSLLEPSALQSLIEYTDYIREQEKNLKPFETQKTEFINTYFVA